MEDKRTKIRSLNDDFRTTGMGGRIMITTGIQNKGEAFLSTVIAALRSFDDFTEANDPYGEHDFGSIETGGERVFWKIDYYDQTMRAGSSDPSDPSCTTRVLTLMLAEEY